jgi:hypothetical protein
MIGAKLRSPILYYVDNVVLGRVVQEKNYELVYCAPQ